MEKIGADERRFPSVSYESGHQMHMAKLMAVSILAYTAVPILMFYAADRKKLRLAMAQAGLEEVRFRFDFEGTKVVLS